MAEADKEVPFFSAVQVEAFSWKVKVPVPVDGHYVHATFTGRFRYMSEAQLQELLKDPARTERDLARHVLLGIVQLQGEDKPQLRTEPEIIEQVLAVDRAPAAVFGTYMAVLRGLAPEKN